MEKPADFTFMQFGLLREAKPENVQTVRIGAPPRGPNNKLATKAVWLNNNRLKSFKYLDIFINSILEQPLYLTWLDLSFNKLTEVDNSILNFPYLRILYLHGNKIADPKEVVKLKGLPEMRALTVHGNPVYAKKQYRQYMISMLPQLVSLDFTRITAHERDYATAVRHDIES